MSDLPKWIVMVCSRNESCTVSIRKSGDCFWPRFVQQVTDRLFQFMDFNTHDLKSLKLSASGVVFARGRAFGYISLVETARPSLRPSVTNSTRACSIPVKWGNWSLFAQFLPASDISNRCRVFSPCGSVAVCLWLSHSYKWMYIILAYLLSCSVNNHIMICV